MPISDWSSDVCSPDLEIRRSVDPHFAIAEHQGRTRTVDRPEFADVPSRDQAGRLRLLVNIAVEIVRQLVVVAVVIDVRIVVLQECECAVGSSEEGRVGKEWVSTWRSGGWAHHY